MPNPTMWSRFAAALNLKNATRMTKMGLKRRQLGGVLGAYFRGVDVPALASNIGRGGRTGGVNTMAMGNLNNLAAFTGGQGNMGTAAARIAAAAGAGIVGLNLAKGNDLVAGAAGLGAFAGTFGALGRIPGAGGTAGTLLRGAGGLMAGSIAWQGLRGPRMSDYT
jgi:hypothetical protein